MNNNNNNNLTPQQLMNQVMNALGGAQAGWVGVNDIVNNIVNQMVPPLPHYPHPQADVEMEDIDNSDDGIGVYICGNEVEMSD